MAKDCPKKGPMICKNCGKEGKFLNRTSLCP
jgi:hypothetical protein